MGPATDKHNNTFNVIFQLKGSVSILKSTGTLFVYHLLIDKCTPYSVGINVFTLFKLSIYIDLEEACKGGTKYPVHLKVNRQMSLIYWQISP